MQRYCPEIFLQRALLTHMYASGWKVREEVRFGVKYFDVVAFDGRAVHGFEVKIKPSQRALQQALIYQLACDYVHVVLGVSAPSPTFLAKCASEGIGVMVVNGPPDWGLSTVLPARKSRHKKYQHWSALVRFAEFQDVS